MHDKPVVIDTSALAAVLFHEPRGDAVWRTVNERPLIAPALFTYELANVATRKLLAHPDQQGLIEICSLVGQLSLTCFDIPFDRLVSLTLESGLSSYDAAFLWLSRESGAPLVTLDKSLAVAARRLTIPFLPVEGE